MAGLRRRSAKQLRDGPGPPRPSPHPRRHIGRAEGIAMAGTDRRLRESLALEVEVPLLRSPGKVRSRQDRLAMGSRHSQLGRADGPRAARLFRMEPSLAPNRVSDRHAAGPRLPIWRMERRKRDGVRGGARSASGLHVDGAPGTPRPGYEGLGRGHWRLGLLGPTHRIGTIRLHLGMGGDGAVCSQTPIRFTGRERPAVPAVSLGE